MYKYEIETKKNCKICLYSHHINLVYSFLQKSYITDCKVFKNTFLNTLQKFDIIQYNKYVKNKLISLHDTNIYKIHILIIFTKYNICSDCINNIITYIY